jgi:acetyl-CoA carboxylase beta subunit
MGILRRDRFAAVLLDHDLHHGSMGNARVTGEHVATVICETQNRDCRVLIHSQSVAGARKMAAILEESGFEVESSRGRKKVKKC